MTVCSQRTSPIPTTVYHRGISPTLPAPRPAAASTWSEPADTGSTHTGRNSTTLDDWLYLGHRPSKESPMVDRYTIRETDQHQFVVVDRMSGKVHSRPFATYLDAWNYIRSMCK